MAAERPFKKQGAIPFTWEIRPGVPKQQHVHQLHGSSDCNIIFEEEQRKKKSCNNVIKASPSSRFQSDQPQKKPRSRTRARIRSLLGIFTSGLVGDNDKVKVRPECVSDLETMASRSVKKSWSMRSFSSGPWSSSLGHDVKWSAFGFL